MIYKHSLARTLICLVLALCMIVGLGMSAFAADDVDASTIQDNIEEASDSVLTFLRNIVVSIGAVAIAVCGIVLLLGIGGQRASENAKSWMLRIAFGVAIIMLAEPIIKWIQSVFQ